MHVGKSAEMDRVKGDIGLFALPILLLDIALLPVSPFFSLPFSMPIVAYFILKYYNRRFFEKQMAIIIFASCLIVSTINSVLFKEDHTIINNVVNDLLINVHVEDIKRCIYLLLGLLVYKVAVLLYLEYRDNVEKYINRILVVVCCAFTIMAVIFSIDVVWFYDIKGLFFTVDVNMLNNEVLRNAGYLERFNFILLDPNNASYFILIIAIYLIENANLERCIRIGIWVVMVGSALFTMSLGGASTLLLYITIKIMNNIFKGKLSKKAAFRVTMAFILITLFVFVEQFTGNRLMNMILESQSATIDRWAAKSMSDRLDIYISLWLESFPPLIGDGYTIIRNGQYFYPHSDHLRFLYSYGIVAYVSLLVFMIRKRFFCHQYLFIIPALVAFSINSLIDETRLLFTFLILFAIVNTKFVWIRCKAKNKKERIGVSNVSNIKCSAGLVKLDSAPSL